MFPNWLITLLAAVLGTGDATVAPVADAGPDQTVRNQQTVVLDGSGSSDEHGHLMLWQVVSGPGSGEFQNRFSAAPGFTPTGKGSYVIQLTVDNGEQSAVDSVVVEAVNNPPQAILPSNREVTTGTVVQIDGGDSVDIDGDPLTYRWSLASRPTGSAAELVGTDGPYPAFHADTAGDYLVQLVVGDGHAVSQMKSIKITAVGTAPAGGPTPGADAFYVAPDGDDSYSGTSSGAPFGTIQHAVDAAGPGDTIYLRAGSYHEQVQFKRSGDPDAPITVTRYGGDSGAAVIDGTGVTLAARGYAYDDQHTGLVDLYGVDNIVLDDITVRRSSGFGVLAYDADDITVRDLAVSDTYRSGIGVLGGSGAVIQGNNVVLAANGGPGAGILVGMGASGFNVAGNTITRSGGQPLGNGRFDGGQGISLMDGVHDGTVNGNDISGIDNAAGLALEADSADSSSLHITANRIRQGGGAGITLAAGGDGALKDIYIYNNLLYGHQNDGIFVDGSGELSAVWLLYNTLQGNGKSAIEGGIRIAGRNAAAVTVRNNIVTRNNAYAVQGGAAAVDTNLLYSATPGAEDQARLDQGLDLFGDPAFNDPNNGDFSLRPESAAIDAASDRLPLTIDHDFAGTARPVGERADIGAFEFRGEK